MSSFIKASFVRIFCLAILLLCASHQSFAQILPTSSTGTPPPANKIVDHRLTAETDADRQRTSQDGKCRQVDINHPHRFERNGKQHAIKDKRPDCRRRSIARS